MNPNCASVNINLGKSLSNLAYTKPEEDIYFVLSNLAMGASTGKFITKTVDNKIENPLKQLKRLIKPKKRKVSLNRLRNSVDAANLFSYETGGNSDSYNTKLASNKAENQLRKRVEGMMRVSNQPNVLKRNLIINDNIIAPPNTDGMITMRTAQYRANTPPNSPTGNNPSSPDTAPNTPYRSDVFMLPNTPPVYTERPDYVQDPAGYYDSFK